MRCRCLKVKNSLVYVLLIVLLFSLAPSVEARTPTYTLVVGVSGAGGSLSVLRVVGREFVAELLPKSAELAVLGTWGEGQNPYRDLSMAELVTRMEVALGIKIARHVRFNESLIVDVANRLGGVSIGGRRHTGQELLDRLKPPTNGMYLRSLSQAEVLRAMMTEALRWQNWVRLPGIVRLVFRAVETNHTLVSALGLLAQRPTRTAVVHLSNPAVLYDGRYLPQRMPLPMVVNGRTLVPLRLLAEIAGATALWDEGAQRVTLSREGQDIAVVVGQRTIHINDVARTLEAAPVLFHGRVMVPFRIILEHFGYKVAWLEEEYVVKVWR
ncbi:MAG: hypothetical protein DDT36_01249 [Firmicutes bacterium]|nr:hypothetical protein [Bacillota bacterium]